MSRITSLALTDVRCFAQTQRTELPRITVLVGENSSGKSTFLGCARTIARLSDLVDLSDKNPFDDPPFSMGSFKAIAHSGASKFAIEATFESHRYDRVRVVYDRGPGGEPRERELELSLSAKSGQRGTFRVTRPDAPRSGGPEMWRVTGPEFEFEFPQSMVSFRQFSTWLSSSVRRGNLPHEGDTTLWRKRTGEASAEAVRMFARFTNFFRRSDLLPGPEHRLSVSADDPNGWPREREYASNPFGKRLDEATLERIVALGRRLNLFGSLDVRRGPGGTYEIRVNASGEEYNVVDVGFGIHSVLPLLHAIASAPKEATLLLQQPETHLHPQAQAALVRLVAQQGHRLLVETHSDHFPDWFRIAVMSGDIDANDLGIVYFDRIDDGASTILHNIRVDDQANLIDTPPRFRQFFLDETERLLGFRR
ncbi:AAA family ATPase [Candidatus Palauibacter sp.]|uniref:AAA family ATPase n=1 Tax=Candidatus Palauibacter sp. TaxID=3101350 RepID=UPI003B58D2FE